MHLSRTELGDSFNYGTLSSLDDEIEDCLAMALDENERKSMLRGDSDDGDDDEDEEIVTSRGAATATTKQSIFKTTNKKYAQKFGKSFSKAFVSKRKIEEKNARLQIRIMSMQIAKRAMMESHMVTAS